MMEQKMLLIDAMGGDHAPDSVVRGSVLAVGEAEGFEITLIGDEPRIRAVLTDSGYTGDRIHVVHTTEVISGDEQPVRAIRSKKNSSMVTGFNMLNEKKGRAFISAGSSGALMAGALFILGRMKGVDRPALPALLPSAQGHVLLIDAGLNSMCKSDNYYQFGIMGSMYMKTLFKIDNPTVGLLNMGTEEGKGNDTVKQAFELLRDSELNFIGNMEGSDILEGKAQVIVCDGYVGNVALKLLEGSGKFMFGNIKRILMKNPLTKLAAAIIKGELKKFSATLDPEENGGAPVLGVNGLVMKSHGGSTATAIKFVILKTWRLVQMNMVEHIAEQFANMEVDQNNAEQ